MPLDGQHQCEFRHIYPVRYALGAACFIVFLLVALAACKEAPKKAAEPPLRFEDILYSDRITNQTFLDNNKSFLEKRKSFPDNRELKYIDSGYTNYGFEIYRVLFEGYLGPLETNPQWTSLTAVAFGGSFFLRYQFVPDVILKAGKTRLSPEEQDKESTANHEAIEAFWKPWINRLYGNEGAWYREKAKSPPYFLHREMDRSLMREIYTPEKDALLRQAAELKDPEGMYLYGVIRFREYMRGYQAQNPQEGWPYVLAAAEAGYAPAQIEVAQAYVNGFVVKKNEAKAGEYFEKALNNGYRVAALGLSGLAWGGGKIPADPRKCLYYLTVGDGDFVTMATARHEIGNDAEADAIQAQANARVKELREEDRRRQEALEQRWLAMVPEIKKAMYEQIPWLVWTLAPDSLREATRREYLAKRNGAAARPATSAATNGQ